MRALSYIVVVVLAACGQKQSTAPCPDTKPTREAAGAKPAVSAEDTPIAANDVAAAKTACVKKHGEANRAAVEKGVDQVASLWRVADGDLGAFCEEQFVADPKLRDQLFERLQEMNEQMKGHFLELGRTARWNTEVDTGPMAAVEPLLAAYDPTAHTIEDMFKTKVAFAALLNFPLTKLADRLKDGESYSRRQWAEVRLTGKYDTRVPGALLQAATAAEAAADQYIAGYYLWMHHVLAEDGKRLFPAKKHLITHWNLRDELKANYADADGLAKQRVIIKVMERIVTQQIPAAVIDNPNLDWNPFTNKVTVAEAGTVEAEAPAGKTKEPSDTREADTRFEQVRRHLAAGRAIDPYVPVAPTVIERAFDAAEMPEDRVRKLLVEILESPLAADAAKEMQQKLGRKLEPSDIWYEFGQDTGPETELDKITTKKYPTPQAFEKDIPRILRDLGFTPERASYVASHITVDSSRGAGHAMGAERRGDKAHLRTRVEPGGMTYKGYNIAVHELGHNVEQTFSLYDIDYTLLSGVPNTAFTEALAFLFQARDLELLGKPKANGEADRLRVLDAFWNTREIAGSALVELDVWHWLYDHPNATAAEIREATVKTAQSVWNKYYEPTLGGHDSALLGIYSHTITSPLYLFNYVLGHLIAFQVEEHVAGKDKATFAKEFERVCRLGMILPDLWMKQATGNPVTAQPLLDATARALKK
ncbi:MAG TPA: hypothetical protein VFV99_10840 [Kofleriaceae bacterium]|nr:hypothetical protein [Kofleriaceae bacterium]